MIVDEVLAALARTVGLSLETLFLACYVVSLLVVWTGLWLIGIWERSPASQHIKQLCGNPEAISSAYSLYDYEIAADLGGSVNRFDITACGVAPVKGLSPLSIS